MLLADTTMPCRAESVWPDALVDCVARETACAEDVLVMNASATIARVAAAERTDMITSEMVARVSYRLRVS
jgi:hypothetical protein